MPEFLHSDGGVLAHIDDDEATLLRNLLKEMRMLLEADIPRADPVVARLFPDAYETDEDSENFREMVDGELRAGKLASLRAAADILGDDGPVEQKIDGESVEAWLTLLTDMRLAIGTRLGITQEKMEQELDATHPDAAATSVLHWLGWVQESMLAALIGEEQ